MKKKKILAVLLACMCVFMLCACGKNEDSDKNGKGEKNYTIGIIQIMEHASLNTIRDAIVTRLGELATRTAKIVKSTVSRQMVRSVMYHQFFSPLKVKAVMSL